MRSSRASAGKYSYASPGTGTPPQLVGALFRLSLDLDLVHVPFSGGGPAIGSTVAGHTPIRSARWRRPCRWSRMASCVRSRSRQRREPRRCLTCRPWRRRAIRRSRAAVGPRWPCRRERRRRSSRTLNRMIVGIVTLPDIKERLGALGYEPIGNTPDQCTEFFGAKWRNGRRSFAPRASGRNRGRLTHEPVAVVRRGEIELGAQAGRCRSGSPRRTTATGS